MGYSSGSQIKIRRSSLGAVLLELAITLPLLLLFVAGTINIASIIWQTQLVMEAMSTAGRKAANLSNDYLSCTTVENEARTVFNTYVQNHGTRMGISLPSAWEAPQVCLHDATYDGYSRRLIQVTLNTQTANNCLFCMANFIPYIPVSLTRNYALEWDCTGGFTPCS